MEARAILRSVRSVSAIGGPQTARQQLADFIDLTKPDELIVTAQIYDQAARLRSYELLVEAAEGPATAHAN